MPRANRANNATVEARIHAVFELMTSGITSAPDIQTHIARNDKLQVIFGDIDARTLRYYTGKARQRFIELAKPRQLERLGQSIARYESLYHAAVKVMDFRSAISAQKALDALLKTANPAPVNTPAEPADLDTIEGQAVATLTAALASPDESTRTAAARALIEYGQKRREQDDISARLDRLEESIR